VSNPIKPPGGPSAPDPSNRASGAGRLEDEPGELEKLAEADAPAGSAAEASAPDGVSRLAQLRADLASGRIGVDDAIERMVRHAVGSATGLPPAQRSALEAQLRAALSEDPTLIALRRDLERGSRA
jgi:hypothetical protein